MNSIELLAQPGASDEGHFAEFNTSSEAEPVCVAPRLTCMILAAASWVPCTTFRTRRAISWAAGLAGVTSVGGRRFWPL
jgi:hypothetical protein